MCLFLVACNQQQKGNRSQHFDLVIQNALVIDGTGGAPFSANVYISDDTISLIDQSMESRHTAERNIDAEGRFLTPGLIDLHAHGDPTITPEFENFLAMGVTTISLGQDGSSPYVENQKEWQDEVDQEGVGVNLAMFVGHGTLRTMSGIGTKEKGTAEEMQKLHSLLRQNLEHCFGLSTGLEYAPGIYAPEDELIELARIVGESDRMIMSHMRNEDDDQLDRSINELIAQGAHARVHVSHLKSVYGKGTERANIILQNIKEARSNGIEITADIYPYTASYTGIGILFPDWCKTQEQYEKFKKTRWGELAMFIRNKVHKRNGPEATLLGSAPYAGKTLADLEKEKNKPFEEIVIDEIGPRGASGAYFVMNEKLQSKLLVDPLISICSDGSPKGYHPRGHGTFARIIEKYVVNERKLKMEEAIRKMTSYAASILSVSDRGIIAVGKKADLILFNPLNVKENADYSDPFQLADGFDIVIVNGKVARENGKLSGVLYGRVLQPET